MSRWTWRQRLVRRAGLALAPVSPGAPAVPRWQLALLLAAVAAAWLAERLARAFLPVLLRDHPMVLIVLDPGSHDLLLAGRLVGVTEFVVVATASRFAVHFLYYLLGRWYGPSATAWLARRWRRGEPISNRIRGVFDRVAGPAVFLISNKAICVLAGLAGMSPLRFTLLHLPGTALRVAAIYVFAGWTRTPVGWTVDFITRNADWLTWVFACLTVAGAALAWQLRRVRRRGEPEES